MRFRQTSDIEAQSALLEGWNQSYSQLSGGAFAGTLVEAVLPRAYLFREVTSHSLLQMGHLDPGMVAVGVPLRIDGPASFAGGRCGGSQLHLFSGRDGFEFHTPEGLDIAVAVIPRSLLMAGVDAQGCARLGQRLERAQLLSVAPGAFAGLRRLLTGVLPPDGPRQVPISGKRMAALTADLAQHLRSCLLSDAGDAPLTGEGERADTVARRMSIIADVRDAIEAADAEEALNIELLCQRIGVSRRTLQYTFERELGLRPIAYVRALRLNKARRLICQGETVTEAATEAGFWHFGRFAQDYRGLFGERPSSTLRSSTGPD
ncbi:helix-turn-helix domain-containing protein [Acidimangrovimonas sediminis]|uniref:helix-turn-helix domain-containing protein n=1 Tax=Acidimangrovimonas sediminis TaxID=2056283 RepID=UPI001304A209|nr:helix-turn-helix domain-containing protein [Acidimangrovimonas sediminis]